MKQVSQQLKRYGRTPEGLDFTRPIAEGGQGIVYEMDGIVVKQDVPLAVKFQPISEGQIVPPDKFNGVQQVQVDYVPGKIVIFGSGGEVYEHTLTDREHLRLQNVIFERQTLKLLEGIEGVVGYKNQKFYVLDGMLFSALFMEHLKGYVPLDEMLPGMDQEGKYHVIAELGEIVHQLGERNIVHKDLKPDNVEVSQQGDVKLLDFGIARMTKYQHVEGDSLDVRVLLTERMKQEGTALGTIGYLSPEEVRGQPVTHRSDTFSYGMTTAHALLGYKVSLTITHAGVKQETFLRTVGYDSSDRERVLAQLKVNEFPDDVVVAVGRAIHPIARKRRYGPLLREAEQRREWNGPYEIVKVSETETVAERPSRLHPNVLLEELVDPEHFKKTLVAKPAWQEADEYAMTIHAA